MANSIGWRFGHDTVGMNYEWGNSDLSHFKAARYPNLAREIIQNSMDAALDAGKTVNVSFELKDIPVSAIDGDTLKRSLEACLEREKGVKSEEIEKAISLLSDDTIPCLVISDKNTTGLSGGCWKKLVTTSGGTDKQNEGAGGSHGIGKNAVFAISPLRSVFYWTAFENETGEMVEKMQGRSILASHCLNGQDINHIGFWGENPEGDQKTLAIENVNHMPKAFRKTGTDNRPRQGTSVIVLGFSPPEGVDWREEIARGVVSNFFYAIQKGKLDVSIEPEPDADESSRYYREISDDTLEGWFQYLLDRDSEDDEDDEKSGIQTAYLFHRAHQDPNSHRITIKDETFGTIKLYILQESKMPNRAGFVRKTGMLVTENQEKLRQFPGFKSFICLVVIENKKGNILLQRMENVQHDAFSAEWLPESEQEQGKKALENMCKSIRNAIKEIACKDTDASKEVMQEIARLLPEINPDEDDDLKTGDGDDIWTEVTPNPGKKMPKRKRPPSGRRDVKDSPVKVPISKVRITNPANSADVYKLSFRPGVSGDVVLSVKEQGGYSKYPIEDVAVLDHDMVPAKTVTVKADTQTEVFLRSSVPLDKIRCEISATKESEKQS